MPNTLPAYVKPVGEFLTYDMAMLPEGASQSFAQGDFVTLDSNGNVIACQSTAGSALLSGTKILGVTLDPGHNLASPVDQNGNRYLIRVAKATDATYFDLPVFSATLSSAVTAETQVGLSYNLINKHDVNGIYAVDLDDTTNTKVEVQSVQPQYPVGSTYGLVRVKVLAAQRAAG